MAKDEHAIKVRKPSFFLYWLAAVITRPFFALKWRHKIERCGINKLKSPIVAIGNHSSTIDIILSIHALMPKRFNIITGRDLFTWGALKPFIKAFGAIPKSQNAIDLQSMRTMKAAVEQKRNILIFPEGKTSIDGKELSYLAPAIGKFIKFMDCPVIMLHTNGSYLTRPRYIKGFKKGKIVTKAFVLLTQDEVRNWSGKEIYDRINKEIKFNDHVWQKENNIRFKSKEPAQNLNYILYKCPKCGAEYEMKVTDGRFLECGNCGNKVEYTEYGEFKAVGDSVKFDRVDLWYDYQRGMVTEELKSDNFEIAKEVTLKIENAEAAEFEERGEGILKIKDGKIIYNGTLDGKETELLQNIDNMSNIVTKNAEGVDLMFGDIIYRFLFKEHKWSTKYGLIIEQNFALKKGLIK